MDNQEIDRQIAEILRGKDGRFISKKCPECGGTLQPEECYYCKGVCGSTIWHCDGLVDPENTDLELQPCMYSI